VFSYKPFGTWETNSIVRLRSTGNKSAINLTLIYSPRTLVSIVSPRFDAYFDPIDSTAYVSDYPKRIATVSPNGTSTITTMTTFTSEGSAIGSVIRCNNRFFFTLQNFGALFSNTELCEFRNPLRSSDRFPPIDFLFSSDPLFFLYRFPPVAVQAQM